MVSSVKDQYVGDVSDYLKYATLRAWSRAGLSTGLAWMRTDADLRPDGSLTRYLERPESYRGLDADLFDGLARIVASGRRSVRAVVDAELVVPSFSYETVLGDGRVARSAWFAGLTELADTAQVIFLDPDNGLEVSSIRRGRWARAATCSSTSYRR
jgi:hypothetical protein